ncbi:GSU2403 family nucleotidyltransferase fold protein [Undibacterium flavidum]|uniref:Nucleotidyltransferase-like domain-containing protein n=1 Tax=Undibacterium flavidum TaxID=2762297 RepID=A0ABR6Y9A3_9BURK|nr:GSU2403 family nucleotidyltransferase fold protein [Undibacterium flavidum]MBC3873208.1 hypothetical protein [Undibacterium flavidum]
MQCDKLIEPCYSAANESARNPAAAGLPFIKAKTGLKPGGKSETYKLPGKEKLLVDLLVNGSDTGTPVLIPELNAYAQSVLHLDYLVDEKMESVIFSKTYTVPVYTPNPARFAIHKLFSALSRINQSAKSDKDILQAATVICATEDKYPGDIEDALLASSCGKDNHVARHEASLAVHKITF